MAVRDAQKSEVHAATEDLSTSPANANPQPGAAEGRTETRPDRNTVPPDAQRRTGKLGADRAEGEGTGS